MSTTQFSIIDAAREAKKLCSNHDEPAFAIKSFISGAIYSFATAKKLGYVDKKGPLFTQSSNPELEGMLEDIANQQAPVSVSSVIDGAPVTVFDG
jgi:hypothetical protein